LVTQYKALNNISKTLKNIGLSPLHEGDIFCLAGTATPPKQTNLHTQKRPNEIFRKVGLDIVKLPLRNSWKTLFRIRMEIALKKMAYYFQNLIHTWN